jgi:two-component system, cell cycle sensor histidine kinase and response regulator CckA
METVLVVDDEQMVLNLCRRMLELGGYTVLTAESGSKALDILQTSGAGIDLALIDVVMPEMNGIELAARVQDGRPGMRILLMSGFGPKEIGRIAGNSQPYGIIWKPFKTDSLIRMIENTLARSTGTSDGF